MKLEGFAELDEALAELEKMATQKAVLRRALKKAAQPTADKASGMAPVLTGALAGSVTVSTKLDKRQAGLHRKMFRDDRAAVEMFVGPSYTLGAGGRHGHLLEFGTYKMAAQPFMRPAWDSDKMALLDRLKVELRAEIDRTVARAARRAARIAAAG
jgi:HK97 gp10 family phage protein